MELKLEKTNEINTEDILFDTNLKQFCIYPKNVEPKHFDVDYIFKNCLKLSITPNN